jgi:DNA-binding response OmpR family regulator
MERLSSVLIVDDEPSIRLMFRTALQRAGIATSEAGDGLSALARLRESRPDVILLDLKMPGMDGMETLRRMRQADDDTSVVIVTAHGSIPDAVAAMRLGAVDFLTKPVTPESLRAVVSEVILRHDKQEQTATSPRELGYQNAVEATPVPQSVASRAAVVVEVTPPVIDLAPVKHALNKRDFLAAERLMQEALDRAPDCPEAHTLMGVLQECLGQTHAAYQSYRTALLCAPGHTPALNNLRQYCERFGLDFHSKAINPSAS